MLTNSEGEPLGWDWQGPSEPEPSDPMDDDGIEFQLRGEDIAEARHYNPDETCDSDCEFCEEERYEA
jgi:hypothetical protein